MRLRIVLHFTLIFLSSVSWSVSISSIKGKSVFLQLSPNENPSLGQKLLVVDGKQDREVGLIEITKVHRRQATARLIRGRIRTYDYLALMRVHDPKDSSSFWASGSEGPSGTTRRYTYNPTEPNDSLVATRSRGLASIDVEGPSEGFVTPPLEIEFSKLKPLWGVSLGFSPITVNVSSSSGSSQLTGLNFLAKVHYTVPIQKELAVDMSALWTPMSAHAAHSTLGIAKFQAQVIGFDAVARFNFWDRELAGPWIGGGGQYQIFNQASSNIISSSSIGNQFLFEVSAGYNRPMNNEFFSYRFDYLLYSVSANASGAVDTSQMILSAIYYYR